PTPLTHPLSLHDALPIYRLGANADGGYRIYLDGKKFVDDSAPHGTRTMTTLVHLQAGHAYPIRIEYFHGWWEATARLLWLPPNLDRKSTRLNSSHVAISY